ncbi:hypothetical protein NHX12_018474 [Muraenolepis orangiensis]|uniref:Small integral membrane protein 26 n=1 Tax=Muraenolepis orangiensis TaxID=630683 RepID=A0A9Q0IY18_9TELE|nr:hypothetical protein NHX12_018474 [Muraenolepis orangiensis]
MSLRDFTKWNNRAALLYAVGAWTMIGSVGYYSYKGYVTVNKNNKKEEVEPENPNQLVYRTAHTRTVVVCKEDFVPYTTRVYNFFNPPPGNQPGTGGAGRE